MQPLPRKAFSDLLSPDDYEAFDDSMRAAAAALRGHTMWHMNSTKAGGGVAEMLSAMLPYVLEAGIDCRWVAVSGGDDFLEVTKRLHNALHGFAGDGGPLGEQEKELYTAVLADAGGELVSAVRPGDVVFAHDPQTAGLVPALKSRGATVIWHCHIGTDYPDETVRHAWQFLRDEVAGAQRYIFTRAGYLWEGLDPLRMRVIQPSINPFSNKNRSLSAEEIGQSPERLVLQTSRWDRLKDPLGVLRLFADHLAPAVPDVHLVVAGPAVDGVADDPEGAEVLAECFDFHKGLPTAIRARAHLVCTPMEDLAAAEVMVNAWQRRAEVVLQKSLAEGFGLVVAEAMWKQRPVVASGVGGIQDQIVSGDCGVLIGDPSDGAAFARAAEALLADPAAAKEMGERAHRRVAERFLTSRQLTQTMRMLEELLAP